MDLFIVFSIYALADAAASMYCRNNSSPRDLVYTSGTGFSAIDRSARQSVRMPWSSRSDTIAGRIPWRCLSSLHEIDGTCGSDGEEMKTSRCCPCCTAESIWEYYLFIYLFFLCSVRTLLYFPVRQIKCLGVTVFVRFDNVDKAHWFSFL